MADFTAAPPDDTCGICLRDSNSVRTRAEHGAGTGFGHVFASTSQMAGPRRPDPLATVRKITPPVETDRPTTPSTNAYDLPLCDHCHRPKQNHRGAIGHRFAMPGEQVVFTEKRSPVIPPRDLADRLPISKELKAAAVDDDDEFTTYGGLKPATSPVVTTRALIVEALERAIATIDIANHPIIRDLRLKVQVGIERQILQAEATVVLSLIFSNEGAGA